MRASSVILGNRQIARERRVYKRQTNLVVLQLETTDEPWYTGDPADCQTYVTATTAL